jgi:hypothetical protein
MAPLWIGLANFVGAQFVGRIPRLAASKLARPGVLLLAVCLILVVVCISVLLNAPYPLADIFLPVLAEEEYLLLHTRQALQYSQVCSFGASFLWLGYLFLDQYRVGLLGSYGLWPIASLPLVVA